MTCELLMLDLFAGHGGASKAMRERGWRVHRVDLDPGGVFDVEERADLLTWEWHGPRPDLVWGSPPCDEFAREFMPWSKTGVSPSLALVEATMRIVRQSGARYWAVENVKGAARYLTPMLGTPQIFGPFFIWSNLPPLGVGPLNMRPKESYPSSRPDLRAIVPDAISLAVAVAVEQQMTLFDCLESA